MYTDGQFRDLLTERVSISEELAASYPIDGETFNIEGLSPEQHDRLADEMIRRWVAFKIERVKKDAFDEGYVCGGNNSGH